MEISMSPISALTCVWEAVLTPDPAAVSTASAKPREDTTLHDYSVW